jgi:hypothetical protein
MVNEIKISVTLGEFSCNAWMQPGALERMKLSMKFSVTDQKFSCSAWSYETRSDVVG